MDKIDEILNEYEILWHPRYLTADPPCLTPTGVREQFKSSLLAWMEGMLDEVRKANPYPPDIFIEPTKEQFDRFNKSLKENGLAPDAYNGSMGRRTWSFCCDEIKRRIKEGA